jgi:phosphoglycolate phosphatase
MNLLIFDLDGTLVDSKQDLVNSVNATRSHMGRDPIPDEIVATYVGRGAPALIRSALGAEATDADVARGLEYFLAYYRDHMLDFTRLYPGVREALDRFREAGLAMAVLTNKPVRFSQTMIDRLGLGAHFFRVYGGNSFEQKKPHPIGIEKLMEESRLPRETTLVIGDSAVDVRTARNAGVKCCGVTYGFQPESFTDDPPDFLVDRAEELDGVVMRA